MPTGALTYKHIRIGRDRDLDECAGRPIWYIFNRRTSQAIGSISWYSPWGQYVAGFAEATVWSTDCLRDVQDAIAKLEAAEAARKES